MPADFNPLTAPPPAEIPLPSAPLVRVIAQVRFPLNLSIENRSSMASLQEHLRDEYPVLAIDRRVDQGERLPLIWRFSDADNSWMASLGADFMALETSAYQSRKDFLARLERFLSAVGDHFDLRFSERLGVRYIDRIEDADTGTIRQLIRPEMIGIANTDAGSTIHHAINEILLNISDENAQLRARCAQLPPGMTVDPNAIEPIGTKSWLLDLDMFRAERRPFDVVDLRSEAQRFAERIYTFFRWAVKDEFLRYYGGKI